MHSTRVAIGVRVKLNENFKEKCLGDKGIKIIKRISKNDLDGDFTGISSRGK